MSSVPADVLRGAAIFRKLSADDRERVARVARVIHYQRGDRIFAEDDPSEDFFVVTSGRVKVFKMTPAGQDVILEIFTAGDPLGAVAVYDGRPFQASAMALDATTCVVIPRAAFFELLEQHPSLVRGLLAGLTQRLVELTARIAELTGGRVEPRFARATPGYDPGSAYWLFTELAKLADYGYTRCIDLITSTWRRFEAMPAPWRRSSLTNQFRWAGQRFPCATLRSCATSRSPVPMWLRCTSRKGFLPRTLSRMCPSDLS